MENKYAIINLNGELFEVCYLESPDGAMPTILFINDIAIEYLKKAFFVKVRDKFLESLAENYNV